MADAFQIPTIADARAAMVARITPGTVKVLYCTICGALTFLRFAGNESGVGDPVAHQDYHERRGEVPAREEADA